MSCSLPFHSRVAYSVPKIRDITGFQRLFTSMNFMNKSYETVFFSYTYFSSKLKLRGFKGAFILRRVPISFDFIASHLIVAGSEVIFLILLLVLAFGSSIRRYKIHRRPIFCIIEKECVSFRLLGRERFSSRSTSPLHRVLAKIKDNVKLV